jgi:hypothetical protein
MPNLTLSTLVRPATRLCVTLAAAGCAAPPVLAPPPAAETAHLIVVNFSDYAWQLDLTPTPGQSPSSRRIAPRATVDLPLPGGSYAVDQSLLNADGQPASTRHLSVRFDAGRTYRWPLATLFSSADSTATGEGGSL